MNSKRKIISEANKIEDNKNVKKFRIALIVFFVFVELTNILPYMVVVDTKNNTGQIVTVTEMIITPFTVNEPFIGIVSSLFLVIPFIGILIAAIDTTRKIKAFAGIITSILGIVAIFTIVTPTYIAIGSLLALVFYVITLIISFALFLAKKVQISEYKQEKQKKEDEKSHVMFKLTEDGKADIKIENNANSK